MIFNSIIKYIEESIHSFESIAQQRKETLAEIASFVANKLNRGEEGRLVYICTHNSRRSHFGQIWSQVAASYYNISNVVTFSGGTEATSFNRNAIHALENAGFIIENEGREVNPVYTVMYGSDLSKIICFSKTYDHEVNPKSGFCAILMCSEAEANCPFVSGAEQRISTTYDDPKAFDNTPDQEVMYKESCRQIAIETIYTYSLLKKL